MISLKIWFRCVSCVVLCTFSFNIIGQDAAHAWSLAEPQNIVMPPPGTLLPTSMAFSLPTLKGISIDPQDPFKIDFVVDTASQNLNKETSQEEVNLLIKYFLSFLTLPEKDLWVNLSPYEKGRVIASEFAVTNAGRDMLVQDYILKQLASSLTYPEHELGKVFWKKVFSRAKVEYGSTDIPVNTYSKVWVVPDKAIVYEANGSAFITESRLKVLTEEDYLSIEKHTQKLGLSSSVRQKIDHLSTQVTREIIIPELEREVNEGQYFSPLRQMYNSLILAIWFKKRFKENVIGQVFVDKKKTYGILVSDKKAKEEIYAQYIKAYQKGVYNFVKEDLDTASGETIGRKYFSGGFSFVDAPKEIAFRPASQLDSDHAQLGQVLSRITVLLNPLGISKKNLMSMAAGAFMVMGAAHEADAKGAFDLMHHAPAPPARVLTITERSYNDVKSINVVEMPNKHVMKKLEAAEKVFENIQPGQAGYELREDVFSIYKIMHDDKLRHALGQMPFGVKGTVLFN